MHFASTPDLNEHLIYIVAANVKMDETDCSAMLARDFETLS